MEIIVSVLAAASILSAACSAAVLRRVTAKDAEKRQEAKCEKAMEEQADQEDARRKEAEMAEGIENIMNYQVKLGRGRTTGGEA